MEAIVVAIMITAYIRIFLYLKKRQRPLGRKKRQRYPLGRMGEAPRVRAFQAPPRTPPIPRPPRRRPTRDAAARARRVTAIGTAWATCNFAAGGIAVATGHPTAAIILYIIATMTGAVAFLAAWPALRRRHVFLKNPSLVWCLLAGEEHRRQLRLALSARRDARAAGPIPEWRGSTGGAEAEPAEIPQCRTRAGYPAGSSLKEYRLRLGLTAARLDSAARLSPGTVLGIEAGSRRVTVRTARALEAALQSAGALYTVHYIATPEGWLHYSGGKSVMWFGRQIPRCRCDECWKA